MGLREEVLKSIGNAGNTTNHRRGAMFLHYMQAAVNSAMVEPTYNPVLNMRSSMRDAIGAHRTGDYPTAQQHLKSALHHLETHKANPGRVKSANGVIHLKRLLQRAHDDLN